MFHRDYDNGREALHSGIDRLVEEATIVLRALARIQFAAPWRQPLGKAD